jgi:hypothetical protein
MSSPLHRDEWRLRRLASVVTYSTSSSSPGAIPLRWERSRANRRSPLSRRRTRRVRQERQGFKKASRRYSPGSTRFAGRWCRTALQPWLCPARKLASSQRRTGRAGRFPVRRGGLNPEFGWSPAPTSWASGPACGHGKLFFVLSGRSVAAPVNVPAQAKKKPQRDSRAASRAPACRRRVFVCLDYSLSAAAIAAILPASAPTALTRRLP